MSPFEYLYGTRARLPSDVLQELPASLARLPDTDPALGLLTALSTVHQLRDAASEQRLFAQARQSYNSDEGRLRVDFHQNQLVWLSRESVPTAEDGVRYSKFLPAWLGPFRVWNKINDNAYCIEGNNGVRRSVNVRHLKPFHEPLPELARSGDIEAAESQVDTPSVEREDDPSYVPPHSAMPALLEYPDSDDDSVESVHPLTPPTGTDPDAETEDDTLPAAPAMTASGRPLRSTVMSHRFARPQ